MSALWTIQDEGGGSLLIELVKGKSDGDFEPKPVRKSCGVAACRYVHHGLWRSMTSSNFELHTPLLGAWPRTRSREGAFEVVYRSKLSTIRTCQPDPELRKRSLLLTSAMLAGEVLSYDQFMAYCRIREKYWSKVLIWTQTQMLPLHPVAPAQGVWYEVLFC